MQNKCKIDTKSCYEVGLKVIILDDLIDKFRPGDYVDIRYIIRYLYYITLLENMRKMSNMLNITMIKNVI